MKSFENYPSVPNEEARNLYESYLLQFSFFPYVIHLFERFETDKDAYFQRIRQCVDESLERRLNPPTLNSVNNNQVDNNCSLVFSEPQPEHLEIIKRIFYRSNSCDDLSDTPLVEKN